MAPSEVVYGIRFDVAKGDIQIKIVAKPASEALTNLLSEIMAKAVLAAACKLEGACQRLFLAEYKDIPDSVTKPIFEELKKAYRDLAEAMEKQCLVPLYKGLRFSWRFGKTDDAGVFKTDFCILAGECWFGPAPTVEEGAI